LSREHIQKRLRDLRIGLQHAFATPSTPQVFTLEDEQLLERMAETIVKRGMAAPATVFLESMGPMNFLGSQAVHFLRPIIEWAFHAKEIEQVAQLLERRDTVPRLIALIEARTASNGAAGR
jgi:hypothetical protein